MCGEEGVTEQKNLCLNANSCTAFSVCCVLVCMAPVLKIFSENIE